MRILEIGIIILNLPVPLMSVFFRRLKPKWLSWLPLVTMLLVLFHFFVEGYRWQMMSAFFVSGVLFMLSIRAMVQRSDQSGQTSHQWLKISANVIVVLLLCLAATLSILLPVFSLPTPTGPHSIGTVNYHWVDQTRPEIYTEDTTDVREIMVQIWYPAEHVPDKRPVSYWGKDSKTVGRAQANSLGLPEFIFGHISLVTTHSFQNAPVLKEKPYFPVVIYSHGYRGSMNYATFHAEELASHGYIVVSINHTYDAFVTMFPDGRRVNTKSKHFQYPDTTKFSKGEIEEIIKRHSPSYERMTDVLFALDKIEELNADSSSSLFVNRIDLTRIGAIGFSFGAGSVRGAAERDKRIKVALFLDGGPPSSSEKQPSMHIFSESRLQWRQRKTPDAFRSLAWNCYVLSIAETEHSNFDEGVLITPLKSETGAGPIRPKRAFRIVNDYTLAFFGKYLNNQQTILLDSASPKHSEVQFVVSKDIK